MNSDADTIVAVATPPGTGAISIVRLSGPAVLDIASTVLGSLPRPREAVFRRFRDASGKVIDEGIGLFFSAPHSFSGEDMLEIHVHGSLAVLEQINTLLLSLGARMASPGEFSQRAFCNGKYDLLQLEGIADLISSAGASAARGAQRSLQGEFSKTIRGFCKTLESLRVEVEADIDFFAEDTHEMTRKTLSTRLDTLHDGLLETLRKAQRGKRLGSGAQLAIAGQPNVGKSTLFNCLAGRDEAIVSNVPGTTRDVLRCEVLLRGVPVTVHDTAGLHTGSTDAIEVEGMKRARDIFRQSDLVLLLVAAETGFGNKEKALLTVLADEGIKTIAVCNKADLLDDDTMRNLRFENAKAPPLMISAKTGAGIGALIDQLLCSLDAPGETEDVFVARARHIHGLQSCIQSLQSARGALRTGLLELVAEDLARARQALAELVGEQTTEALLGEIFSSFCVGK